MRDPFDDLRRYARTLQTEVRPEHARTRVAAAMSRADAVRRPRRVVVVFAAAGALVLSNVALAFAAEPAVPGDALYGVDRAYERLADGIGLGGPHAVERLGEAEVLLQRGRAAEALDLVREALAELTESEDVDEARALLGDLVEGPPGLSEGLRGEEGALTALLELTRDVARGEGKVDGQAVADAAKKLREAVTENTPAGGGPPEDPGRPDDAGGGPPFSVPPSDPGRGGNGS